MTELRPKVTTAVREQELMEAIERVWPSGMSAFLVKIENTDKEIICTGFFYMKKVFLSSEECMRLPKNNKVQLYSQIDSYHSEFLIDYIDDIKPFAHVHCKEFDEKETTFTLRHAAKVFVSMPR